MRDGLIDVDPETLWDLGMRGLTQRQASQELGISEGTLSRRLAKIQAKQGLLMKYRALQSLQLTELQARVLEAITPEKIAEAPLKDLITCFKILKDKELVIEGKPSEIKGLVGYLVELEKKEFELTVKVDSGAVDEVIEMSKDINDENYIPDLD
jgi:transcriptional regulator with XRE-family HTH domain